MVGPDETRGNERARERTDRGANASQVSREIVQLHSRHYGRGPTRAKTYIQDEFVLCVLEDAFTPAERTLVAAGKVEQVQATRRDFQDAIKPQFIEIVERIMGRHVRAFLNQVHADPEVAVELFLLAPIAPDLDGDGDGHSDVAAILRDGKGITKLVPAGDGNDKPPG